MDNKYKAIELSDEQMAMVVGGKEDRFSDGACGVSWYLNSEGKCSGYSDCNIVCRDCKYSELSFEIYIPSSSSSIPDDSK